MTLSKLFQKYILRNNSSGEGIDSGGVEVFKAFLKSIGINMVEGVLTLFFHFNIKVLISKGGN